MNNLQANIKTVLKRIPRDFGGGCSVSKAYLLAFLIRQYRLTATADIGVYRGRSLFPQALAHRSYTGGVVYGIDPWQKSFAKEQDTDIRDKIDRWIEETDFEAIYQDVNTLRSEFDLQSHCVLLRQSSQQAALFFEENGIALDLVHIDGNHDTQLVMQDVALYFPKLKANGYIVLDDLSWVSIQPAYEALNTQMSLIYERRNKSSDDYAVFWNNKSRLGRLWHRLVLTIVMKLSPI